jgi:hypothetical protein
MIVITENPGCLKGTTADTRRGKHEGFLGVWEKLRNGEEGGGENRKCFLVFLLPAPAGSSMPDV